MIRFPIRLRALPILLLALGAAGCDGTSPPAPLTLQVDGVRERGSTVQVGVVREGATVDPASVQWSFDPAGSAEVAGPGSIRLLQAGQVTLTARAGASTGTLAISVAEPPPLVLEVQGTPQRGATVAVGVRRSGVVVAPEQVQWSFAPAGAAELAAPGQLRLLQSGTVTLSARAGESSGELVLTVAEPPPSPLVVTLTGLTERGATLTARITRDGAEIDPATVTWLASPAGAVQLVAPGQLRLLQAGVVTLTATLGPSTGQVVVTVTEPAPLVVQVTGRRERGSRLSLRVLRDGSEVDPASVAWTATPASAAEFTAGEVRLRAAGAVTLTAQVEHRSGSEQLQVAVPPTVVFDRVAGGNRDIWKVALDGGDLAALTTNPGDDQDPTTAGGTVVFTSFRGGTADLYAVLLAGGADRALLSGAGAQTAPALSRDGRRVAYTSDAVGVAKVWTVGADGTGAARATPASFGFGGSPEAGPAWNPAGDRLAFVAAISGSSDIFAFPFPGGEPQVLVGGARAEVEPAWSPDGTRVAFVSNRDNDTEIYLLTVATGAVTRLTARAGSDAQPAWTADGRLVYVATVDGVARLRWLDPANPAQVFEIPTGDGAARNPAVAP